VRVATPPKYRGRRLRPLWPSLCLLSPWATLAALMMLHLVGRPLIEGLTSAHTAEMYSATSQASASLLGLIIATLAIMLSFPDRPEANLLRTFSGWPTLQLCLLITALNLLVLLMSSLIGIWVDHWVIREIFAAFAAACLFGLGTSGALFALILLNLIHGEPASD
jgi:hypothetical protein